MKISSSYTIYTGKEANYPYVAADIRQSFPNFDPILNLVAEPQSETFKRQSRWTYHVLRQLTFSYLSQEYLSATVMPVLDSISKNAHLTSFPKLHDLVDGMASGKRKLETASISSLNNLAINFFDELNLHKRNIIADSMNDLGRLLFGNAQKDNVTKTKRSFNLLAVAMTNHLSEYTFSSKFREALSFQGYKDCDSLKEATIKALEQLRDDFQRSTNAFCLFVCPDIKMDSPSFDIGPVTFFTVADVCPCNCITSSQQASEWFNDKKTKYPHSAFVFVKSQCHPDDGGIAIENAASVLDEIMGFLVSQGPPDFAPPKRYESMAFIPGIAGIKGDSSSGKPHNSCIIISPDKGAYYNRLYSKYIAPALTSPVDPILQEKLRRMLRTLRRASYAAGCLEYSQAYGSAWQAYEVVFGGTESRDRGDTIAKRVAGLAVELDGIRTYDAVPVTGEDIINFANEYSSGSIEFTVDKNMSILLKEACTLGPTDTKLNLLRADSTIKEQVLAWKEKKIIEMSCNKKEIIQRRDEIRKRFQECYKLRNDIVHAGYDDESTAEIMYQELFSIFSSFVINLAYNCSVKLTYGNLLNAIDQEWQSSREDEIRTTAYTMWEKRGRPIGDDLTDWFNARKSLGLRV